MENSKVPVQKQVFWKRQSPLSWKFYKPQIMPSKQVETSRSQTFPIFDKSTSPHKTRF